MVRGAGAASLASTAISRGVGGGMRHWPTMTLPDRYFAFGDMNVGLANNDGQFGRLRSSDRRWFRHERRDQRPLFRSSFDHLCGFRLPRRDGQPGSQQPEGGPSPCTAPRRLQDL
jgi:hypothetical protein